MLENITCSVFSITYLANLIGFFTFVIDATAPALRFDPSIIDASISCLNSDVYTDPLPALNKGLSSIIIMALSTASKLVPPSNITSYPESAAIFNASSIPSISSSVIDANHPAPP